MPKKTVVLSMLGSTLDKGAGPRRWNRWRPTVDLHRHDDLLVDRLELIVPRQGQRLAAAVVQDIASVSPETTVRTHRLDFEDPWDFEEVYTGLLDFVRGLTFRDSEDYLVHISTGTHVMQICWFLLTEARFVPGRILQTSPEAGNAGPGHVRIIDLDLSSYGAIRSRFEAQHREDVSFLKRGIETRNLRFNALIDQIETVAMRSRAPMLLTGPTGAGKTQLARRIYGLLRDRGRVHGRFVEVNCATLRGDQAMSTLFGHKRGAFTGAVRDRAGVLAEADGGVVFLDEVGELGLDEQAMLLRAIEDRRFMPLGSDAEVHSDFGLIAGTNRDLRACVAQGTFREDLLARIDLWTFELPGLAQRPEDVEPNLEFELDRFAAAHGRRASFTRTARTRFLDFAASARARWPGNFRDFAGALTRMATLAPKGRITPAVVREEVERLEQRWGRAEHAEFPRVASALGAAAADLDRFDAAQLEEVLRVCAEAPSLSAAGRVLFAASRARRRSVNDADRLRKYLAKFDLDFATASAV
ncbi:MAG: RNA repair transcriptional activator RtcR [Nannocystaceae bacterium]|nr:RNA repair transcriptional activator RtcR [bacterium]